MTVLWFLQRPKHSFRKPAVFVSLASCYVVIDDFFFLFTYQIFVLFFSFTRALQTLRTFILVCCVSVLLYLCCGFTFLANRGTGQVTGFL